MELDDRFHLARLHSLKVSQPSQTLSPPENLSFKHTELWRLWLILNHNKLQPEGSLSHACVLTRMWKAIILKILWGGRFVMRQETWAAHEVAYMSPT